MFDFLKEEQVGARTQMIFVGDKLDIYLPATYLSTEPTLASVVGEYIETLGLFSFKVDGKLYSLSIPFKFLFEYSEKSKFSGKLEPNMKAVDYEVYTLHKGDIFFYDLNHKESLPEIMFFMNTLIEGGKMPEDIAYSDILSIVLETFDVLGVGNMGLSSVSYELLLSELYRTKNNINTPYRKYINDHPNSNYDYKMIKLNKIPETTSNFLSLLGEDLNHQIVSAIYNTRTGRKDKESPAEKLLKY